VWGPIEPSQISRWATVDKASVSRAVTALEQDGLVSKASHSQDGRKQLLTLTRKGQRTFRLVVRRIHQLQKQLFEGYGQAEQKDFFRLLNALEDRLREMLAKTQVGAGPTRA
jgi:DNA-binding MarR family transcriptional regulator